MNQLKPMLLTSLKNYNRSQFVKDVTAGIIVAIIALPLSIALALASGVGPEAGIFTAIVAGFVISALGGSSVQIAGPTAAFATIVAGIVAKNGMDGLIIATILAGVFLILMGLCHFGSLIKFIPYTITTGFTSGIAVTIFIGQIKDFLGLSIVTDEPLIETMDKLKAVFVFIGTLNIQALLVGALSLAILIFWPMLPGFLKRIPASLIAVIAGSATVAGLHLNVNTIGDLYEISNKLPAISLPTFSLTTVQNVLPDAFTIAILAAIESLLSCVVADSMVNSRHRSNMELIAQGAGNITSALFGGIPATGAIARTMANINNGGKTPVAGMVHAVVLLLILLFLMPLAQYIPMACLAGVLVIVSYNMSGWRTFKALLKNPKSDVTVLLITFFLTVIFDLTIAIEVGLVIACVLFMRRVMETTEISVIKDEIDPNAESDIASNDEHLIIPEDVEVYEINGPYFFGIATKFEEIMARLGDRPKVRIIRMRKVPFIDSTGIHNLTSLCEMSQKEKIIIVLSGVNEKVHKVLEKSGFYELLGEENICPNINVALERAKMIIQH